MAIAYGAKRPGRQGTPIQLADGQAMTNINIGLPKGAVITGVVVDEFGEPTPNTTVRSFRYMSQNGQKTLQAGPNAQTDDRGIYRLFQLPPGDYLVTAVPRNAAVTDFTQQLQNQLQPLLQQVQAAGGIGALTRGGGAGAGLGSLLGAGGGQQLLDQVQQLQQQLSQQQEQPHTYAPVFFPGTTSPAEAGKITVGIGEERSGVDFQLQLVATSNVRGHVLMPDGTVPTGAQVQLRIAGTGADDVSMPMGGVGTFMGSVAADGTFAFQNVTPGQYALRVRAPVRQPDTSAAAGNAGNAQAAAPGRGRGFAFGGGRGGQVTQVLWASADITVDGRDIPDVMVTLQPGMTVTGRVTFEGSAPPADLTTVRVALQAADGQLLGGVPSVQADSTGNFTLTGVAPGRYYVRPSVSGAGRSALPGATPAPAPPAPTVSWRAKSVIVSGQDALDTQLDVKPNDQISGILVTFTDKTQELSGTLQDAQGQPTSDYTIILFAAENRYWTPESRRILSTRPGTDGTFSFSGFPAGQYRLTAVTDADPGEWFDPAFLGQVVGASLPVTIGDGEKKTQDIRLAGR